MGIARTSLKPAVFFDRDGVVNELVPDVASGLRESPLRVADVRLIEGAADGLRRLHAAGFLLVGVSNQPAAAKEKVSLEELDRVHLRVLELLRQGNVIPDGFEICHHHPEGTHPVLGRSCDCRKPRPGMLWNAASALGIDLGASWMIGDTDADVEAGSAAGCRTVLVEAQGSRHKRAGRVEPDIRAPTLAGAVPAILDRQVV